MNTLDHLYAEAHPFVALTEQFCAKHSFYGRIELDHLCFKCGSRESFEEMRNIFEREGARFWTSPIAGRSISYFILPRPIISGLGKINYLELSDQKPDGSQKHGFDHVEAYPLGWPFERMVEELSRNERVVDSKRPHHLTHDIDIGNGFEFRASRRPLIEKIVSEEILQKPRGETYAGL